MLNFFSYVKQNPSKKGLPETCQVEQHLLKVVPNGRRKSVAVKLKGDQLILEVPKRISQQQLDRVLSEHHQWVLKQIEKWHGLVDQRFTASHQQSFEILGDQYQCIWQDSSECLVESSNTEVAYKLCHASQQLQLQFNPELDESQKQMQASKVVAQILQQTAQDHLAEYLACYAQQMKLEYQSVTIKGYKSRWGSCYSDGRIQFNWRLFQAPEWVVNYVIVHELAHLVHHNHSAAFWQLVEQHYPQTKAAKKQLKLNGHRWIEFLQQ